MDLILWRHAEAEDGFPDLARELTDKGHKQAGAIAKWLAPHLPKNGRILASPAVRAQQTAQALKREYQTVNELNPGASHGAILTAADWPTRAGAVVVVGHQPTLGRAAAWILSGEASEWNIKKGALWWITYRQRGEQGQVVLRAVMSPEFL